MATSVTPSAYTFFKNSSTGVSSVVGYENSSERGIRYTFKLPDTCKAGATSYSFKKSSVGGINGNTARWNWAVSEDASAFLNSTAAGDGYANSGNPFSGSANKTLYPGKTYYLFIYPGSTKYGWRYWNYPNEITLTVDGSITYTITYKPGTNGTGSQATQTKTYGTAATLKGATFTRTGYTQTGWSTTDGGSKTHNLSSSYSTEANLTLYPVWTANSNTVTVNANSGKFPDNTTANKSFSVTYASTTNSTIPTSAIPTRQYYTLNGFYTATSGGTKVFNANGTCVKGTSYWDSNGKWKGTANLTVYAQWTRITVSVNMDGNGGTVNGKSIYTATVNAGSTYTLPTASVTIRDGATFKGWGTAWDSIEPAYAPGGSLSVGTSAITLYAVWQIGSRIYIKVNGSYILSDTIFIKYNGQWLGG